MSWTSGWSIGSKGRTDISMGKHFHQHPPWAKPWGTRKADFVFDFVLDTWNRNVTDYWEINHLAGWTTRLMCTQKEQQGSYMAMAAPIEILKDDKWSRRVALYQSTVKHQSTARKSTQSWFYFIYISIPPSSSSSSSSSSFLFASVLTWKVWYNGNGGSFVCDFLFRSFDNCSLY
jgi:hypothetical protein